MSHASIIPMEVGGKKMYVYCASGGVAGVAADDGTILWDTTAWRISIATVPSPVPVGGGRIFLTGGYNAGSMMLEVKKERGEFAAEPVFRLKPETFGAELLLLRTADGARPKPDHKAQATEACYATTQPSSERNTRKWSILSLHFSYPHIPISP